MNIEIANRLLEYRKRSGLSQEELAEKLDISRQSVSKWERAEASPDTDNLIELAKIYGVTMDDLLNVDKPIKFKEEEPVEHVASKGYVIEINKDNNFHEDEDDNKITLKKDGVYIIYEKTREKSQLDYEELYVKVEDENKKIVEIEDFGKVKAVSTKAKKIKSIIDGGLILLIVLLYVALCTLEVADWGKFWIIFVAYPMLTSLVEAIVYKDVRKFAYPIFVTVVYLVLGMYFDLWHPFWFVFVTIPLYYVIINIFVKKDEIFYLDNLGREHSFTINKGDIKVIKIKEGNN
ncbi:MAG: helix-turn-helix transcriptional regulator [Bacilli bacterium]|nr:helix-turn-helix transcriptional regulator [Bacilli bacterium]